MRADRLTRVLTLAAAAALLVGCQPRAASGSGDLPTSPVFNPTPTPVATATSNPCDAGGGTGSDGIQRRSFGRQTAALVPDALFVTYASRTAAADSARSVSGVRAARSIATTHSGTHGVLALNAGADPEAVAAMLRKQPGVTSVSRVHYRTPAGDATANDTYLDNVDQWYLYKTSTDSGAWSQTHGTAAVKIAVIDTGIDETNQDLTANLGFQEAVLDGATTTTPSSIQDTNGHGSSTAGLADAATNNSYGFASVGYASGLMAFNVFPATTSANLCPTARADDIAQAIDDAVSHDASVISMSLVGSYDAAEETAVADALAANVTIVAAAGNDYTTSGGGASPDYPAAFTGVIAVGASAVTDSAKNTYSAITAETVASYSNSGPTLVAPGGDEDTTISGGDKDFLHWVEGFSTTTSGNPNFTCTNSGSTCRALWNGTSQATPQVAGTAALMMAVHGGARSLTPAAVSSMLTSTADVLPGISTVRQGAGRLNVSAAVSLAH